MKVLAIDPGPEKSGYVIMQGDNVLKSGTQDNDELLAHVWDIGFFDKCAIETLQPYGNLMNQATIDTAIWAGRFFEATCGYIRGKEHSKTHLISRKTIAAHLTGSAKSGDAQIREALCIRFGEPYTGARPKGKLKGISGHAWSALAVACYFIDTYGKDV